MFNTILVAVDGSDVSKKALEAALEEARVWKSELNAVYIIETGGFENIPADSTMEVVYNRLETIGNEALKAAEEGAKKNSLVYNSFIREGHAGDEIVRLAEEIGADLIVLGSHGKSGIDRLLLGSVTDFVTKHSKVSTMVVRL
jgi:nucleotide-binding universal stress UspA family protein